MREHKIACIVLNYNDSETTISLVDYIKRYQIIDYIIIIDNASTDDSIKELDKLSSEKIVVYQAKRNAGYGAGNNVGIQIARERYECDIALIANPDVEFEESCIEKLVECFGRNPQAAVVAPVQKNQKGQVIKSTAWKIPSGLKYALSALFFAGRVFRTERIPQNQKYWQVDCVTGAFLAVRVDFFLKVGGYDERIFLYGEETTLGYRLKQKGLQSFVVTDEFYLHRHAVSTSKSIPSVVSRKKIMLDSRLFIIKHYLGHSTILYYFAKICFNVAIMEEYIKCFIRILCKYIGGGYEKSNNYMLL